MAYSVRNQWNYGIPCQWTFGTVRWPQNSNGAGKSITRQRVGVSPRCKSRERKNAHMNWIKLLPQEF